MNSRIVFIAAVTLVLSSSTSSAQGQPQKQVVISKPVLKSMVANKPKSKSPLGARAGIVRRTNISSTKPMNPSPTSVRQIKPSSTRK